MNSNLADRPRMTAGRPTVPCSCPLGFQVTIVFISVGDVVEYHRALRIRRHGWPAFPAALTELAFAVNFVSGLFIRTNRFQISSFQVSRFPSFCSPDDSSCVLRELNLFQGPT